ncbi:hypothetical protein GUITHDRAFT_106403 [Guillardia theta CCMP2712]|uniref:Sushi domain-containing protein n=1 Tax=Guillardia theta (strain CCMP2712) TaxID=905079 RepID=L1JH66_GUITC|nr:hypothetical protein GUITHDRAFT_106403 [Guillardia theta CCMP2712]EKX47853.1 hypothetical protein GUITHDRAFT_106403 [Guillardia theta CCMP2712]|eukprot:XP_005834833.1 hypothetical protein GUITHDRAFT_106403 [Guillardia theta CCMP2712]
MQFGSSAAVNPDGILYTLDINGEPKKVIAGEGFLCVILVSGDLFCSGSNSVGQAGIGGKNWTLNMVQVNVGKGLGVVDAAAGAWHTCAILNNSQVKCWGYHTESLPACGVGPVAADEWARIMKAMGDALPPVSLSGTPVSIAAGNFHTCVVLADGNTQCWGSNFVGELGYGVDGIVGFTNESIPVVELPGDLYALRVWAGGFSTCVLLSNGRVACWGQNSWGMLGYSDSTDRGSDYSSSFMKDYFVMEGVEEVAIGSSSFSCFLLQDQTVRCVGNNDKGQLGNGQPLDNSMFRYLAEQEASMNGLKAIKVVAGIDHACAVLVNLSTVCWGGNLYGQIKDVADQTMFASCLSNAYCTLPTLGNGTFLTGNKTLAGGIARVMCDNGFTFQNESNTVLILNCLNSGLGKNATWDRLPPKCVKEQPVVIKTCPSSLGLSMRGGGCFLPINSGCQAWTDWAGWINRKSQAAYMSWCMEQDCSQSLETASNWHPYAGCRYVDANGFCMKYESAQEYCVKNPENIYCKDGGLKWALQPLGNASHQPSQWYPKSDVSYYDSSKTFSCSCLKQCRCHGSYGDVECDCYSKLDLPSGSVVRTDFSPVGAGDFGRIKEISKSSWAYQKTCSCMCDKRNYWDDR